MACCGCAALVWLGLMLIISGLGIALPNHRTDIRSLHLLRSTPPILSCMILFCDIHQNLG